MFAYLKTFKERVGTIVSGEWRHPHRRPLGAFMSDRTKAVQLRGVEEARRSGHELVGTEHLLLGILAESTGEAVALLRRDGIQLPELRTVVELLNGSRAADPKKIKWFNTPHHTSAIFAAEEYSRKLGCPTIEPEHVLYGVLQGEDTTAFRILRYLGTEPQDILPAL